MQPSNSKSLAKALLGLFGYVLGTIVALSGISMVLAANPPSLRPVGLLLVLAGLLLMPPTGKRLGERWPKLSAWYTAPLLGGMILTVGLTTILVITADWEREHPEIVAKREADRKARQDAARAEAQAKVQSEAENAAPSISAGTTHLDRTAMLDEARSALKANQPERALTIVYDNAPSEMLRTNAEVKALVEQIEARIKANDALVPNSIFAEKVQAYWLPQVSGIATTAPASAPDVWTAIAKLEDAARALEASNAMMLDQAGKDAQRKLQNAIAVKQRALFPILRATYGKIVGQVMWERDIDVRVAGAGNRRITWTGGLFAARANIARAQGGAQTHLLRLRFTHSSYEWVRGISERYTYTMDAPSDDAVGYWDQGAFKAVR